MLHALLSTVNNLNAHITHLQTSLHRSEMDSKDAERTIERLNVQLERKKVEIGKWKNTVSLEEGKVKELEGRVKSLEGELRRLKRETGSSKSKMGSTGSSRSSTTSTPSSSPSITKRQIPKVGSQHSQSTQTTSSLLQPQDLEDLLTTQSRLLEKLIFTPPATPPTSTENDCWISEIPSPTNSPSISNPETTDKIEEEEDGDKTLVLAEDYLTLEKDTLLLQTSLKELMIEREQLKRERWEFAQQVEGWRTWKVLEVCENALEGWEKRDV
ncbi:hypothetical protein HDV05_002285 [Chytridiales sp. JEL 0842]|nr:hypothetical protein HDV05_002285 [Chytridiales sp. JEL 0842]